MIDLDKFPTSETAKQMLRRVSPIYSNSYVAKWLYQVMGEEWDEARAIVESLREQAFTETVTWGIEYQEHKYSIPPDESLSLDERRARLIRKTQQKFPLNPGVMEQYLKNGWGITTDIDETVEEGYLQVTFPEELPASAEDMLKDLRRIKPSHLVLMLKLIRELRMDDDEGMIRVNVVPYRNGKHSIHHIEPPDESEMLAYSATGFHRQGRHAITIGPAELSVETPLFSGLATFRAGKIRIPADLSELPQDIWDILTDSVVEGFAGIGRYSCGKHAIGIQLPEDGGAALAYGVGTAQIGIKRTGIEVSSGTEKDVRYGLGTSRTGRISIYADLGDIPPSHMPSSHVGLIHVGLGHIGCSKGGK